MLTFIFKCLNTASSDLLKVYSNPCTLKKNLDDEFLGKTEGGGTKEREQIGETAIVFQTDVVDLFEFCHFPKASKTGRG